MKKHESTPTLLISFIVSIKDYVRIGFKMRLKDSLLYLDGVAASLLVLALTQQAVSFHVMARHWHWLHYMEAVTVKHIKVGKKTHLYKRAGLNLLTLLELRVIKDLKGLLIHFFGC